MLLDGESSQPGKSVTLVGMGSDRWGNIYGYILRLTSIG